MMTIKKSYDGGATFVPVCVDDSVSGGTGSYNRNVAIVLEENEAGVYYRWWITTTVGATAGQSCTARLSF